MAYLYQEIMNVPGLSGTAFQRQKQLYERLGSPYGPYTGSYQQNVWLLGKIRSGQTGAAAPAAPAAPVAPMPDYLEQAKAQLEPYFKTLLAEAQGNIDLAKKRLAEDWEIYKGDVATAFADAQRRLVNALNQRGLYWSGIRTKEAGKLEEERQKKIAAFQREMARKQEDYARQLETTTKKLEQEKALQIPELASQLRSAAWEDYQLRKMYGG